MTKSMFTGDIIRDKFRSVSAIADDLSKQHAKDREKREARRLAQEKETFTIGSRLQELKNRRIPPMATAEYRRKLSEADPITLQKQYDPCHEDLLVSLKNEYERQMEPLKTLANTANERLALHHEYMRSKRELQVLRETGQLRFKTS